MDGGTNQRVWVERAKLAAKDATSATFAAMCNIMAGMPFDTAKVRLQTQNNQLYRNPLHCMIQIVKQEGFHSLYKGATPAISGAIMENAVLFTVNGQIKHVLQTFNGGRDLSLAEMTLSGSIAGIFSGTALCPNEAVKCRLQVQRAALDAGIELKQVFNGPLDCLLQTWRAEGVRGVYSGLGAQIARDIPFNGAFFGAYEASRFAIAKLTGTSRVEELGAMSTLVAGGLAGSIAWFLIFPLDFAKSRIQTMPLGVPRPHFHTLIMDTVRERGIRAVYAGCSAAVMRAFPANAALFLAYELSKEILEPL